MGDVNVIEDMYKLMPLVAVCYIWHLHKKLLIKDKQILIFTKIKSSAGDLKAVIIIKVKPF